MQSLRHCINPKPALTRRYANVITLKQLAKHLKINQERILNWEKYSLRCVRLRLWHNVLWVHIQGLGGYLISYRKLEQWIAACRTLIRFCRNLETLNALWSLIVQGGFSLILHGQGLLNQVCHSKRTNENLIR